jgi:hypothetical protein
MHTYCVSSMSLTLLNCCDLCLYRVALPPLVKLLVCEGGCGLVVITTVLLVVTATVILVKDHNNGLHG